MTANELYTQWQGSKIDTVTTKDVAYSFSIYPQAATKMLEELAVSGKVEVGKCKNGKTNQYTIKR
jgi:Mn-dependent DtxR family transcriptional regulator